MSQFGFLTPEWPDIQAAASQAERHALSDPRASAFHARRTLELVMAWLYTYDTRLKPPYQNNLSALIHEDTFRAVAGQTIFLKARYLCTLGNKAVHDAKPFSEADAKSAVSELFHVCFWLARSYAKAERPNDALRFDPAKLPLPMAQIAKATLIQLRQRETDLQARDQQLATTLASNAELDAELQRLRGDIAAARIANARTPDTHDYNEAETRDRVIDLLLREAGWNPDAPNATEVPVTGMPTQSGQGFVDYVLWGDDGRPLAIVEAKRSRLSALKGQEQARLYADCLQAMHGQRPVIFCSNGYDHWIWDDTDYPPRPVQGFHKRAELELLIRRRTTRVALAGLEPKLEIVERYYQVRAIRRIAETFEARQRKALIVMATGAGKTRTVIALAELLMRANWVKRILFLADRKALVTQAVRAFAAHLPASAPVNLLTDRATEGRVFVSTYPTMMSLIDEQDGALRRFGPGHFDLIVVDEAHRSIYRKYGAIFEYFDSLLVGLTATPRDEIDRNTYGLFELETGVPTDVYALEDAVRDGFLVPMQAVSVPLRFQREGIRYDQLSNEERDDWDALEWDEEDGAPDQVDAQAINKWLFNADTVDKVLAHLMTHGQRVENGDRLGKTIIFAKNHDHAKFIGERFDLHYPHLRGSFARVIHSKIDHAQSLIDDFSLANHAPHIAISVDMLDTGIDVPEVLNLVFFKLVRSKIKFWQMIGRGTRLCPNLFGQSHDKTSFSVFDFCQNLEYFSEDVPTVEASLPESLSTRLFKTRLGLMSVMDELLCTNSEAPEATLRIELAETLRVSVASMNLDNFLVRPHRRLVETYTAAEPWTRLDPPAHRALAEAVASLPTGLPPEGLEAKQFDLLMLNLQLGVLGHDTGFLSLRDRVMRIAAALEEQDAIPVVRAQMALIQDIQTDEWWQDVTVGLLEIARLRLRGLAGLIESRRRAPIFTNFIDEIGVGETITFEAFAPADSFARFRAKARHFLRQHQNHVAIHKLRTNRQLTGLDLAELERILAESGAGSSEDLDAAKAEGLGLFVRSLVGLDRAAAKEAFATFLAGRTLGANQLEFVAMLIDHLTEQGILDPGRLYTSPYTDLSPLGVDGLFDGSSADALFAALEEVRQRAVG